MAKEGGIPYRKKLMLEGVQSRYFLDGGRGRGKNPERGFTANTLLMGGAIWVGAIHNIEDQISTC